MLLLYRYCRKTGLGRQLCFYMFLTIKGKINAFAMKNTFFASALVVLPFSLGAAISLFWSQTSLYFLVVIASIRAGLRPCLVLHTVSSLCTLPTLPQPGLCERPITAWQIPSVSRRIRTLPELGALTQILRVPLLVLVCILSIMPCLPDNPQFNSVRIYRHISSQGQP